MKSIYYFLLSGLCLFVACTQEGSVQEEDKTPEFYLIDLMGKSEDYDAIVYKDEEHMLLMSYYETGRVREYLVIDEADTVAMMFSENGFPEYMSNGRQHVWFGEFSEHSAHAAVLYENGESEVLDIETETNWLEYKAAMGEEPTKAWNRKTLKEVLVNTAMSAYWELVQQALKWKYGVSGAPLPVSIGSWALSSVGYMVSDDPLWWETIDYHSNAVTFGSLAIQVSKIFGFVPPPQLLLGGAVVAVWGWDAYVIHHGITHNQFGSPFEEQYEMLKREIIGGVWLDPNWIELYWPGHTGRVNLRTGLANFDMATLDWGIKEKPDWVDVELVKDGHNNYFTYTVKPNVDRDATVYGDRSGDVIIYVAGVANVDRDLKFSVTQHSQVTVSKSVVTFTDTEPVTLTLHSPSEETWTILHPNWLSVETHGILTQRIWDLVLTPKTLDNAQDGEVILRVNSRTGGTYDVVISVATSLSWDGTTWYLGQASFTETRYYSVPFPYTDSHTYSDDWGHVIEIINAKGGSYRTDDENFGMTLALLDNGNLRFYGYVAAGVPGQLIAVRTGLTTSNWIFSAGVEGYYSLTGVISGTLIN